MFDIGFSQMLLIAIVALIVVGPKRLPKVARTAGHLLGRLQRYVADVKADVSREMQLDELKKLQQQVQEQAREIESSVRKQVEEAEASVKNAEDDIKKDLDPQIGLSDPENSAPVAEAAFRPVDPLPEAPRSDLMTPAPAADSAPIGDDKATDEPPRPNSSGG